MSYCMKCSGSLWLTTLPLHGKLKGLHIEQVWFLRLVCTILKYQGPCDKKFIGCKIHISEKPKAKKFIFVQTKFLLSIFYFVLLGPIRLLCVGGVILRHCQYVDQWFSTFVRSQPGKFFFIRLRPGIIDSRARYRAATRQLRNIDLHYIESSGRITNEYWIGTDLEGSGRSLI
jgi:hypothetical protein